MTIIQCARVSRLFGRHLKSPSTTQQKKKKKKNFCSISFFCIGCDCPCFSFSSIETDLWVIRATHKEGNIYEIYRKKKKEFSFDVAEGKGHLPCSDITQRESGSPPPHCKSKLEEINKKREKRDRVGGGLVQQVFFLSSSFIYNIKDLKKKYKWISVVAAEYIQEPAKQKKDGRENVTKYSSMCLSFLCCFSFSFKCKLNTKGFSPFYLNFYFWRPLPNE